MAAARAAGSPLQMTQFTSAEDLTKGAPLVHKIEYNKSLADNSMRHQSTVFGERPGQ